MVVLGPTWQLAAAIDHDDASVAAGGPNMNSPTSAEPKTILIVEDNALSMKLFHDLLEAHGYDTLQTKDGASPRSDLDGYSAAGGFGARGHQTDQGR